MPNRARKQDNKGDKLQIELPGLRSSSVGPDSKKNIRKSSLNYDSETDWFVSDQEEELIRILEDSSQDEVENYEEQVEELIGKKSVGSAVSLNSSYTQWSYKNAGPETDNFDNRNVLLVNNPLWKGDMEFKILKYAQMIVANEIKKLEDVVNELDKDGKRTPVDPAVKYNSLKRIDLEMRNIANVINSIESDTSKKDVVKLNKDIIKVDKRKKVNLSPIVVNENQTNVANYLDIIRTQEEYWQMFQVETEIWKALRQKNYQRNLETKQKLDQFKGELKLTDVDFTKRPNLENIPPLGSIVEVKKVMLDKGFDKVITNLEDISKRNFNYKGFDPIIEQLMTLRRLQIKRRMIEDDFDNIYSDLENSDLTFEELCKMEQHYEGIERQYRNYYEEEMKGGTLKKKGPERKVVKVDVGRATQTDNIVPLPSRLIDRNNQNFNVTNNITRNNVITDVENRNFVTNVVRNVTINQTDNRTINHETALRQDDFNQRGQKMNHGDPRLSFGGNQHYEHVHRLEQSDHTKNHSDPRFRHGHQQSEHANQRTERGIHQSVNSNHLFEYGQRVECGPEASNRRLFKDSGYRSEGDGHHFKHEHGQNDGRRSQQNNLIEDYSAGSPRQYYANNWWSIYEDLVKNRTKQFGSLDKWWSYYERGSTSGPQAPAKPV